MPGASLGYSTLEELTGEWGITPYESELLEMFKGDFERNDQIISPVDAQRRLSRLGLSTEDYLDMINNRMLRHDDRADIVIAIGNVPRLRFLVSRTFREIDLMDGVEKEGTNFTFHEGMVIDALKKRWEQTSGT